MFIFISSFSHKPAQMCYVLKVPIDIGTSVAISASRVEGFKMMGFPDYFRVELGTAKLLGALTLLIPQIPLRVKEWAYAGFGINMIAATITHLSMGDTGGITMPLVLLVILVVSNIYLHKTKQSIA